MQLFIFFETYAKSVYQIRVLLFGTANEMKLMKVENQQILIRQNSNWENLTVYDTKEIGITYAMLESCISMKELKKAIIIYSNLL